MAGVRVVTDSAADLDRSTAEERGIRIVDLDVRLGEIGPDVTQTWTPEEFWQQCAKTSVLPETSAPAPGAFAAVFEQFADEGADGAVCITLSSKLSATYQAAVSGAEAVAGKLPVTVIDSLTVTMAQGMLALTAADLAASGADLDTITRDVEARLNRVRVLGTLDTLDNLRKGGRIGNAQALLGSLLSIKPVIELRDGVVEPESRQRTRQRSFEYLASRVLATGPLSRLAVVHAAAPDVDSMVDLLAKGFNRSDISVSFIGPVIGTHAGPATVGVCFELAEQ